MASISVTVSLYSVTQGVTWSASSPSDLILSSITSPMLTLFWLHGTSPLRKTQVQSCLTGLYTGCFFTFLGEIFFPHIFSLVTYSVSSFKYFLKYNFSNKAYSFSHLKNFRGLDALSPALLSYYISFILFLFIACFFIFNFLFVLASTTVLS